MSDSLATVDVAELRPAIVPGTRFVPHRVRASDPFYRVEAVDGRYYEVGYSEYVVLSQWDGSASVAESVSLAARHLRRDALSMDEATSLLEWSGQSGLLQGLAADRSAEQKPLARFNPFWLKLPLGCPDRALARWPGLTRAVFCEWAGVAFALLMVAAIAAASMYWASIRDTFTGVLAPSNWIGLAAVWIGLKLIHELAHALAARRFGASVREAGLVLILLAPCAYVDVTSSWSLRSKWQRILIAAAGILAEVAIAGLVVLAWPWIDDPGMRQAAANTLFAATVGSVLFNGNPLMRFDAYYMLSDALGQPNLATRGQAAVRRTWARWLLGQKPSRSTREPAVVLWYGWAAAVWRVVVTVSLMAGAYTLAPGFGPPLVLFGAAALLTPTATGWLQTLAAAGVAARLRAGLILTTAAAIAVGLGLCRWPGVATAPGVVRAAPEATIRAAADGFVDAVLVPAGSVVSNGEPLLQLRNAELDAEVTDLTLALEAAALRIDQARSARSTSLMQREMDSRLGLMRQLRIAREKADRLLVSAPQAGMLTARDWDHKLGMHVRLGDELGLVRDRHQRVVASVPNDAVQAFRLVATDPALQTLVAVGPDGRTAPLTLLRLDPRATTTAADVLLTTPFGGPLAVTTKQSDEETHETVEATFPLVATLPAETPWPLRLPVAVEVRSNERTWEHAWNGLVRYWSNLTQSRR